MVVRNSLLPALTVSDGVRRLFRGFYVNHTPEGANKDVRGKTMGLSQVCAAARLPTMANRRLKR